MKVGHVPLIPCHCPGDPGAALVVARIQAMAECLLVAAPRLKKGRKKADSSDIQRRFRLLVLPC